jgi:septal ring factor EnvC (AmiA/AmiB activator)
MQLTASRRRNTAPTLFIVIRYRLLTNLKYLKMKNIKNYFLLLVSFFFLSCSDISKEAEKKLNELKIKSESLDSMIIKEVDKVKSLDSLINYEHDKVKKLDSLVNRTSSKLDSISNEKFNKVRNILK